MAQMGHTHSILSSSVWKRREAARPSIYQPGLHLIRHPIKSLFQLKLQQWLTKSTNRNTMESVKGFYRRSNTWNLSMMIDSIQQSATNKTQYSQSSEAGRI
jgi:hypothetical protein